MHIRFHHAQAYDWEKVAESDVQPGDVTATNAAGDLVRRVKIDSPHTSVTFSAGSIEKIHADREAAGLPKKSDLAVIFQHLTDAVLPHHFEQADLTGVECDNKDHEAPLASLFGVPVAEPTPEPEPAAAPEAPAPAPEAPVEAAPAPAPEVAQ